MMIDQINKQSMYQSQKKLVNKPLSYSILYIIEKLYHILYHNNNVIMYAKILKPLYSILSYCSCKNYTYNCHNNYFHCTIGNVCWSCHVTVKSA